MWSSSRLASFSKPEMDRRRFDWMLRILRFDNVSRPLISVILFFPSHNSSRPVKVSRPSISLTLFAPSSICLRFDNPSRFSIFVILFCTKYKSLNLVRWFNRLMCLILLNERSSDVSSIKASRPLICAIKLS